MSRAKELIEWVSKVKGSNDPKPSPDVKADKPTDAEYKRYVNLHLRVLKAPMSEKGDLNKKLQAYSKMLKDKYKLERIVVPASFSGSSWAND